MILKHIMEIYVDEDDLPTYASTIADDIQQGYIDEDNLDSAILDLSYELDYDDSYWGGDYDEFAKKMEDLVNEELNRRDEAIQDN